MSIEVAKSAGFCFGVDRAVQMVYQLLDEGKKVYTLGPIIHNPQMIAELEARGVEIIETVEHAPKDGTIVIRAHGVPQETMDSIARQHAVCNKNSQNSGKRICQRTNHYYHRRCQAS